MSSNIFTCLQLHMIVRMVIEYEHDYYCQINNMKPTFMHLGQFQNFLPKVDKFDYSRFVDEEYKLNYLSKVQTVIDCSHYYCCRMGMDKAHMYPEEIVNHIESLLKMFPNEAFENLEITKKRLLELKLNKELLSMKKDMTEKRTKL